MNKRLSGSYGDRRGAGADLDDWSSCSSLLGSDSCNLISSTLAVSGSAVTFTVTGNDDYDDEGACSSRRFRKNRRRFLTPESASGSSSFLRPAPFHRNLSLTLSDPDGQTKPKEKFLSVLQVPNRRATSLRERFRRRPTTVSESDNEIENRLATPPDLRKSPEKPSSLKTSSNSYSKSDSSKGVSSFISSLGSNSRYYSRRSTQSSTDSSSDLLDVSSDLCMRSDLLVSPRVSPLLWLKQCVPALVVSSTHEDSVCGGRSSTTSSEDLEIKKLLDVPTRRDFRGNGSCSGHSSQSDENDVELSTPLPRRGRRQAIFDSKSLGLDCMDLSPSTSCDESDISSLLTPDPPRRRRRSSVDLELNYPTDETGGKNGDRHKKKERRQGARPLLKRNTIADFANTRGYQESTASLISASDQDKKPKNAFSLLKLIDKKCHRSKDNIKELGEVLQALKPSEFKDHHLIAYKNLHWSDLMETDANIKTKPTAAILKETERKRREAVWELFRSECVFLIDHLMVLKHCFMEPLKKVQVEGHLMFAEPHDLFGNLDELCYVSYTFSRDFISFLLKDFCATDFGRTEILIKALRRFCQLTRDGEVYHDYCLNYSKAVSYLEQLRRNEDFIEFEKWCCQDERCRRLQLVDLLISPMQHCTKVPLLLNNIRRYTDDPHDQHRLTESLSKLESSLVNLETKMIWLTNYERIQEIQQQIVWQPVTELEPRAYIPEFLRATLSRQPCERLLSSTKRRLLYEGSLNLLEISKIVAMYVFLFDDILLLTRIKKPPRKGVQRTCVSSSVDSNNSYASSRMQTDGAVFVVHRQPIALDRFTVHDVRPSDSSGVVFDSVETGSGVGGGEMHTSDSSDISRDWCLPHIVDECSPTGQRSSLLFGCVSATSVLKNAFVVVQVNRFQQIIGVYTLQAHSHSNKTSWMVRLHEAQENYRDALKKTELLGKSPAVVRNDPGVDITIQCENGSFIGSIEDSEDFRHGTRPPSECRLKSPVPPCIRTGVCRLPSVGTTSSSGQLPVAATGNVSIELSTSNGELSTIWRKNRSSSSDFAEVILQQTEASAFEQPHLQQQSGRRISDPTNHHLHFHHHHPQLQPSDIQIPSIGDAASVHDYPASAANTTSSSSPSSAFHRTNRGRIIQHITTAASVYDFQYSSSDSLGAMACPLSPRRIVAESSTSASFAVSTSGLDRARHTSLRIRKRGSSMKSILEKSQSTDIINL